MDYHISDQNKSYAFWWKSLLKDPHSTTANQTHSTGDTVIESCEATFRDVHDKLTSQVVMLMPSLVDTRNTSWLNSLLFTNMQIYITYQVLLVKCCYIKYKQNTNVNPAIKVGQR